MTGQSCVDQFRHWDSESRLDNLDADDYERITRQTQVKFISSVKSCTSEKIVQKLEIMQAISPFQTHARLQKNCSRENNQRKENERKGQKIFNNE